MSEPHLTSVDPPVAMSGAAQARLPVARLLERERAPLVLRRIAADEAALRREARPGEEVAPRAERVSVAVGPAADPRRAPASAASCRGAPA